MLSSNDAHIIAESGCIYHTSPQFFTLSAGFCELIGFGTWGKFSMRPFGIRFALWLLRLAKSSCQALVSTGARHRPEFRLKNETQNIVKGPEMTRPIPRIIALTTCLLMGVCAAQAFGGNEYNHINSLARKIHNKSKVLLKETKHYRSTPNYPTMVREVAELDQLACHLRDIAKNKGDLDHLAYDIGEIDAKFHYIENLFDTTELCASTYGRGFIQGHTAHIKRLLNSIEDAIHHIGDDIEHLRATTQSLVQPVIVARPSTRYSGSPIVTRVETYQIPSRIAANYKDTFPSLYRSRTPYGGVDRTAYGASQLHRGYYRSRDYNAQRYEGYDRGRGTGFYIGGGSSRITFGF